MPAIMTDDSGAFTANNNDNNTSDVMQTDASLIKVVLFISLAQVASELQVMENARVPVY